MITKKVFLRDHNSKVVAIFADVVYRGKLMMVELETLKASYIDARVAITLDPPEEEIKKYWIKERFNRMKVNPDFMVDRQVQELAA